MTSPEQLAALPPIVGIVRFSVLTSMLGDRWRATTRKPIDKARRYLFDRERLGVRFDMFETIALPSFDAQEPGAPFHLLVITSTLLPTRWRERLERAVAERPYIRVLAVEPEEDPEAALVGALRPLAGDHPFMATFRTDDDDALARDFVRGFSRHMKPANAGRVLTFVNGYSVAPTSHPNEVIFKDSHYPFNAQGLGYITSTAELKTIYALGSHDKVDQFPSIQDSTPGMWMRSMHTGSDSQVTPRPWYIRHFTDEEKRIPVDEAARAMGERYGFLDLRKASALLCRSTRRGEAPLAPAVA